MTQRGEREFRPTSDVSALRVAQVYAAALLGAADKHGQAEAILEELESLVQEVFRAGPHVEEFLASPAVPAHLKAGAIESAFNNRASELFVNFLMVLNAHGRLELLRHVRTAYRALYDDRARRIRVQVRSAAPLPEDQLQRLRRDLHDVFRLEPVLEAQVDPDLIGGLTVRVGDWLYDSSLRMQLQSIRNQILARSSHEIQSGRDRFSSDP